MASDMDVVCFCGARRRRIRSCDDRDPARHLFVRDERTRNRRAQRIIRRSFRLYILMLQVLGVMKLEVTGGERLSVCQGKLVVANHPTLHGHRSSHGVAAGCELRCED